MDQQGSSVPDPIPCWDENGIEAIPSYIVTSVKDCRVFFVENERTARRFLKKLWREMVIDEYEWYVVLIPGNCLTLLDKN
ncbi:MAG: hypothetical protein WDO71_11970 [Bacteroidota bacterium]